MFYEHGVKREVKDTRFINFAKTAISNHLYNMERIYTIRFPFTSKYKGYVLQTKNIPKKVRQNKTYFILLEADRKYEVFNIKDGKKISIMLTGKEIEEEFESWKRY